MLRLERLRAEHAPAVLAFEQENRAYFARSVPDRGDAYFAEFASRHRALLAEQEAGVCHFHLIVEAGVPLGRLNLVDVADSTAELGYRVGERGAGRGVATAAVREACGLASAAYGLSSLRALTTRDNAASMRVLERNAFTPVAETWIDDRPALRWHRDLTVGAGA
ncbi:GNAT family N-acetyltransferase [Streptomyces sp. CC53]|uniref:GNAT family N-acetyltransferase n=1 Tax=unclassified Streptomyces TaxID=2593676 RepID=UPI0008DD04F7|nr:MULTISPECIES: GNAT family N-acetyltransferase [unclassified Streptomyces]OII63866.1 GNAT family N-acetyltransferase [Streptomyces sp. CC53]